MLDPELKKEIQSAYSQFLSSRELKPRYGQKLMIAEIAKMLSGIDRDAEGNRISGSHIALIEAGTGTGKTIAYLLSTLPIAKAFEKKVVIATATIALQEQVVLKDIPELIQHTGLKLNFCLAKGRGRYMCLTKLENIIAEARGAAPALYEDEVASVTGSELALYHDMMDASGEGSWDGDRDNWPRTVDDITWQRLTTDHRQCTGRKCPHIRECPFYDARNALEEADVIIANHDLVLADLALGGGAILPTPEESIYVFDEGHHLPDKALQHFSVHARLKATVRWLGQMEGQWDKTSSLLKDASYLLEIAAPLPDLLKTLRGLLERVQPIVENLTDDLDFEKKSPKYRFPLGQVGDLLEESAQELSGLFTRAYSIVDKMAREIEALAADDNAFIAKAELEQVQQLLGTWVTRLDVNVMLWNSYSVTKYDENAPMTRWITVLNTLDIIDYELVSSPVIASGILEERLWSRCFASIVCSATLTALQSFERFKSHGGVGDDAVCLRVLSPFDFANNATLIVPKETVEANKATEHTENLIELIPEIIDRGEGTLILFSSQAQMQRVHEAMPSSIQAMSLVQGAESKQALVRLHKKNIDAGAGSILWGLASFSEGVDLPGNYCKHVIIAKLPFSVPDEPLESALAEWIEARGGNSFMEVSVPDTSMRLVQACGRLLRKETDEGRVSILDRRLVSKRYGKALVDSLPPFRQEFLK